MASDEFHEALVNDASAYLAPGMTAWAQPWLVDVEKLSVS